jgi:hypothetical protein
MPAVSHQMDRRSRQNQFVFSLRALPALAEGTVTFGSVEAFGFVAIKAHLRVFTIEQ